MPGANESSTMEWQDAQVRPTDVSRPPRSKNPLTPTTAFSFSSASVTAGSFRSTLPALIAAAVSFGIAAESTLSPAAKAAFGLRPGPTPPFFAPAIARCSCSASPQKAWSPNVSSRKMFRPARKRARLFLSLRASAAAPDGFASLGETAASVPLTITNAT